MKLSSLYEGSHHFERPSCSVFIDHKKWYPNEDIHMSQLQISLSTSFDANLAFLEITEIQDAKAIDALATGSLLTIELGYQGNEELVFMGYIHQVQDVRTKHAAYAKVCIEAMDVKGLMMLHKQSMFSGSKKSSAVVKELLQQSFYKSYVSAITTDAITGCMDYPILQDSQSDYDLLCRIAQAAGFEYFIRKDALLFQKAAAKRSQLELDTWNGIDRLEVSANLDTAFGQVEMISCLGFDTMQSVKNTVTFAKLPYAAKAKSILDFTALTHVSEEFTSMEEMNQKCMLFQQEIQRQYASVSGTGVLLPQLHCGDTVMIAKELDGKEKEGYVEAVTHTMQAGRYATSWRASLKKG